MGQLNELYHYARTHNVTHVVLAVGADDFDFSGVMKQCMKMYEEQHLIDTAGAATPPTSSWHRSLPTNRPSIEDAHLGSLNAPDRTMARRRLPPDPCTRVILQNHWSAIPSDEDIRIPDEVTDRQDGMWASHSRWRCNRA